MKSGDVNGSGARADPAIAHAALIDTLAAVEIEIVRLKIRMTGVSGEALEPLLEEAARLTDQRVQILAELAPVEAALIEERCRALEAARDQWIAEIAELQAGGHLLGDEEV